MEESELYWGTISCRQQSVSLLVIGRSCRVLMLDLDYFMAQLGRGWESITYSSRSDDKTFRKLLIEYVGQNKTDYVSLSRYNSAFFTHITVQNIMHVQGVFLDPTHFPCLACSLCVKLIAETFRNYSRVHINFVWCITRHPQKLQWGWNICLIHIPSKSLGFRQ